MPYQINICFSPTLTDEICGDILVTAIEGGCDYFAYTVNVVRNPQAALPHQPFYLQAEFRDNEDDTQFGTVTIASIATGIERILAPNFKISDNIKKQCLQLTVDPDNCDWDAETADCIVQAALFNEIVYG